MAPNGERPRGGKGTTKDRNGRWHIKGESVADKQAEEVRRAQNKEAVRRVAGTPQQTSGRTHVVSDDPTWQDWELDEDTGYMHLGYQGSVGDGQTVVTTATIIPSDNEYHWKSTTTYAGRRGKGKELVETGRAFSDQDAAEQARESMTFGHGRLAAQASGEEQQQTARRNAYREEQRNSPLGEYAATIAHDIHEATPGGNVKQAASEAREAGKGHFLFLGGVYETDGGLDLSKPVCSWTHLPEGTFKQEWAK